MNRKIMLNGAWEMRALEDSEWISATVPGSVYADLLDAGRMEDPFWRDNELKAFDLMEKDYVYRRTFDLTEENLVCDALNLTCEGLDTLATCTASGARTFWITSRRTRMKLRLRSIRRPAPRARPMQRAR